MAGKSVTAVQDRVLGEFDRVIRNGKSDDVVSRTMERSAKLKAQRERKQVDNTICAGGFSVTTQERGKAASELAKQERYRKIKESANNRDRHSMLLNAIDMFDDDFFVNPEINSEDVEQYRGVTKTIVEDSSIKIDLTIDKPLSTSLRCFADVVWQKPIWDKAEDFATSGNVIRTTKEVTERVKINAAFGDVLEFRRQLLKPLAEMIQRFSIADERKTKQNIWSF